MNVVIYARYSSHNQTEQSIEGQMKVCLEYAKANGYTVVGEYIDRAQTGTNDNRLNFQKMMADSERHSFDAVLVYQLDRFARNRYDSAINKNKLKKNGIRVISARENISDDASGVLIEGVLESMAEYYSKELSQKTKRGMSISASKCLYLGYNSGLGYKVAPDKTFYVDEREAAVVREIFERYAAGESVAAITKDLNRRQIKTSNGKEFNKNSLHQMLRNKRYIGYYIYKGNETPGGMPRIISDELFYRVQAILDKNKKAPARSRGKEEYLLTTKLFCGYCKEMMVGYCGTGKSGERYHYYACKDNLKKKCKKKKVAKDTIENRIINETLKMLTDETIDYIAKQVSAVSGKTAESISVRSLKKAIKELEDAIENLWRGIETGQAADLLTERISMRTAEKRELEEQLAIEESKCFTLSEAEVACFLNYIRNLPRDDVDKQRTIINIFVREIYLYDDKLTIIFNATDKKIAKEDIPLDEIEAAMACEASPKAQCSQLIKNAGPTKNALLSTKTKCVF